MINTALFLKYEVNLMACINLVNIIAYMANVVGVAIYMKIFTLLENHKNNKFILTRKYLSEDIFRGRDLSFIYFWLFPIEPWVYFDICFDWENF